ncbi:peptide chain release factor N(5)-glutamine methyltransferase [Candidatus Saccharibacteria bacterium]|nr:peptide chain release factor N(5)-glutamine methyltransferase [Candidatus Saccharibacteria bacterium]
MNYNQWLTSSTALLKKSGIESARLDCILLLSDQIDKSREWILAHGDSEIAESDQLILSTKVTQRSQRVPLAYIRNTQEFYGRSFYVDTNVLIPRPESEDIISLLKSATKDPGSTTVIDIGTGSGILAITAKLEIPSLTVIATDISESALQVAKRNAQTYGANIEFINSNLLETIPASSFQLPTSILITNLPYVPTNLITSPEITYEPEGALFSGDDGMSHYQRFWLQLAEAEPKPQSVITESLKEQHVAMQDYALQAGYILKNTATLVQQFVLS